MWGCWAPGTARRWRDKPEVSYTELEFDTATAAGLPRLVFLLDTAAADVGIPVAELIDHAFGARQEAFRRRVQASGLVTQSFANPDQLGRLVERSLRELAAARQGAGPLPPGSVLRVWNIPARNPGFTGRDGLLAAVRDRLLAGDTAVVQALHGMGGVGKTQLAIEYAHRFADGYDVAWWVNAEQGGLIGDQFAALGTALGCVQPGAGSDAVRAAVLADLRQRGRWLLVFDNAENPADYPAVAAWRRRARADHLPGTGLGRARRAGRGRRAGPRRIGGDLARPGARAAARLMRTGSPPSSGTCRWPWPRRPGSSPRPACQRRPVPGPAGDPGRAAAGPGRARVVLPAVAGRRDPADRRPARRRGPGRRPAGQRVRVPGPRADPRRPVHQRPWRAARRAGRPGGGPAGLAADPGPPDPAVAGPDRPARPGDAPAHPGHPARPAHPRAGRRHPRMHRGDPGRQPTPATRPIRSPGRGGRG